MHTTESTHQAAATSASRRTLARLLDLILPSPCLSCHLPVGDVRPRLGLCPSCHAHLPAGTIARCGRCGEPSPGRAIGGVSRPRTCASCSTLELAWERLFVADDYAAPLDGVLRGFKFRRLDFLAGQLAERCVERLGAGREGVDVIVPVPLHWRRRLERGFDQAELLAREIGRRTGLPLLRALRRRSSTRAQSSLDRAARRRNVQGAFSLRRAARRLTGRHALLVDDVLTTGATLSAAAAALRRSSPRQIDAMVLARAPDPTQPDGAAERNVAT